MKKLISMRLPENILKEAKKKCIDLNISFSKYVTLLIEKDLNKENKKCQEDLQE